METRCYHCGDVIPADEAVRKNVPVVNLGCWKWLLTRRVDYCHECDQAETARESRRENLMAFLAFGGLLGIIAGAIFLWIIQTPP